MSASELIASVEEYKLQLEQIENALPNANEGEKLQLQQLQLSLLELLELTLQQLNNVQQLEQNQPKDSENSKLEDELALFKAEIAELESDSQSSNNSNSESCPAKAKEEAPDLEGKNVRVPYTEAWGGYTYHNGIVLSNVPIDSDVPGHDKPQVLVLFSQPTSMGMVPCRFYMEGHCKFSAEKCHYSHGELVPVSDLQEYRAPDLESIKEGDYVLNLHKNKDGVWHKCIVQDILDDRSSYSVKCDVCRTVFGVQLKDLIPIDVQEQPQFTHKTNFSDNENNSSSDSENEASSFSMHSTANIFFKNPSEPLGNWEKYTKGIGSKLLSQMGYISGTGLGKEGEGRIDPVEAYVYPPGVSLDRCMELREASGGGDMLQVEKRLLKEQKKMENRQKLNEQKLMTKNSVFDVINNKLATSGEDKINDQDKTQKQKLSVDKKHLQTDSVKDLNKKNYHISSQIKVIERELSKLSESKRRQANDSKAANSIEQRIILKQKELSTLKDAERKVTNEQQFRKDAKKLCVF